MPSKLLKDSPKMVVSCWCSSKNECCQAEETVIELSMATRNSIVLIHIEVLDYPSLVS